MKKKEMVKLCKVDVCHIDNLDINDRILLRAARMVKKNAQPSYSKFFVGAAVLDKTGRTSLGVNVERCTYTQCTHAEQNAIDTMIANGGAVAIDAVAIDAVDHRVYRYNIKNVSSDNLVFPCGHCLQIIWENCEDPDVRILSWVDRELVAVSVIGDLLPIRFGPKNLGVDVFRKEEE